MWYAVLSHISFSKNFFRKEYATESSIHVPNSIIINFYDFFMKTLVRNSEKVKNVLKEHLSSFCQHFSDRENQINGGLVYVDN